MAYRRVEYKIIDKKSKGLRGSPKNPVYDFVVDMEDDNDRDTKAWLGDTKPTDGESAGPESGASEEEPDIFGDVQFRTKVPEFEDEERS
jgi:hypothetical protein